MVLKVGDQGEREGGKRKGAGIFVPEGERAASG